MNGGYTGKNMFGLTTDYPALIREILRRFAAMEGVETHLVGHVISESQPVEDDFRAGEALAREFPGVVLAPRFASPSEAKSYIAGMDFFMGARMHACIAAFSSGVPVIPMAYSRKFAGLFGTLGYERTVECTTGTNEAILEAVFEGFADRAALKAEVDAAFARAETRIAPYEAALARRWAGSRAHEIMPVLLQAVLALALACLHSGRNPRRPALPASGPRGAPAPHPGVGRDEPRSARCSVRRSISSEDRPRGNVHDPRGAQRRHRRLRRAQRLRLGRSFIFILDVPGARRVYLDPCGSLSAVYDPATRRVRATALALLDADEANRYSGAIFTTGSGSAARGGFPAD